MLLFNIYLIYESNWCPLIHFKQYFTQFFSSFSGLKKKLHALKLSKSNSDLVDHTDHETLEKVYYDTYFIFSQIIFLFSARIWDTADKETFFCYCFSTQPVPPIWGVNRFGYPRGQRNWLKYPRVLNNFEKEVVYVLYHERW